MKKIVWIILAILALLLISTLILLFGSLAGCCIALSPAVYGPPYYTGSAYLYSPPVVMAPPFIIAPYSYGGGYYSYPYYHRYHRYHHYRHR